MLEEFSFNEPTKKELTHDLIKDEILDMILDNDKVVRDLFKSRDFTIVVQGNTEEVKFSKLEDRYFCEIPSSAVDILTEEKDVRNLMYGINDALRAVKSAKEITALDDIANSTVVQKIPFKATYNVTDAPPEKEEPKPKKESSEEEGEGESTLDEEEGAGHGHGYSEINMSDYDKETKIKYEDIDISLTDTNKEALSGTHFKGSKLPKKNIEQVDVLARKLLKSFRGYNGKQVSTNPSKRLKERKLCEDSDSIYVRKEYRGGHKIDNINFLVDMSGSMSGEPIRNGVQILAVFNKLAKQKYVTGNIVYSDNSGYTTIQMPVPDETIYRLTNASGGAEGLHKNMMLNTHILKESKILFCITDGQITDQPIDKSFYRKHHINSIGLYVNDVPDIMAYSGKLNRWFDKSLVRRTVPELIDKIVALALRG